ncbi:MBL fold metallo-hydrolase [Bradyrhizobium uaiense]|uniref:MBL fold metallo-hydrolase n=1 Tax=Bradyrhizobium uaiense TaxID=2594946 RepID=A0A6P1BZ56_9BRAD|nr:MBL fold metallo-hydrolase [Bradyrhizobium uaiense]NEV02911.1 MBL fold metallo-hydrolase [Bradyrhizobium uaiense]
MSFHTEPEPQRARLSEVAPGIRRVVASNANASTYWGTNTYLIDGPEGTFVLDPGPADDQAHFDCILEGLPDQSAGIIISHHHSDHFGAVVKLKAATCLPVYAHEHFAGDSFCPDVMLKDQDILAGHLVLHTPGHASDHLCLARADGILFTGDHVMSWNSSSIMLPDGDMAAYYANLIKLLNRNDNLYLPGHGPPLPSPHSYVRNLLERRLTREREIVRSLQNGGKTPEELVILLYRKTDPYLAKAVLWSVEAHLDKLRKEGKVLAEQGIWLAV